MSFKKYILKDKVPVVESDMKVWGKFMEDREACRVALSPAGDGEVSTVFLGLDHNFIGIGPPLLFETMVFEGELHGEMIRTSTWEEAEKTHKEVVERLNELAQQSTVAKNETVVVDNATSD